MSKPTGKPLTLEEFAEITYRIISKDGFDGYLPTAYFPKRCHLAVLEGVPCDIDIEEASLAWVRKLTQDGEEFLVAFKLDSTHFKIVRCADDLLEEKIFDVRLAKG